VIAIPVAELKAFFLAISGLPANTVVAWDDDDEGGIFSPVEGDEDPVHFGILRISCLSVQQNEGSDDLLQTSDADGNMTLLANGARVLSLSVLYESHAPANAFRPQDVLERIRTRLDAAPKWHDRLLADCGCAVVDTGSVVRLPNRSVDTRALPTAALDLTLRMRQSDDVTDTGDGIIETVEGTGNVLGVGGLPYPEGTETP